MMGKLCMMACNSEKRRYARTDNDERERQVHAWWSLSSPGKVLLWLSLSLSLSLVLYILIYTCM